MEEYKKTIYKLWAQNGALSFPQPDDKTIEGRCDDFKRLVIDKFLNPNKDIKILDIGCGWGVFLKACSKYGYENLSGVDSTEKCVNFARNNLKIKDVFCGEIGCYLKSLPDKSQDVITAFDVMEHFERDEILDVLSLIYKKLNKNGIFIMQVPNAGSLSGLYIFYSDITHSMPFTDLLIDELFGLVGFKNLKIFGAYKNRNAVLRAVKFLRDYIVGGNRFSHYTNLIAVGRKTNE